MNYFKKVSILFFMSGFLLLSASAVYAMTPILSISSTGSGDSVQINVTGDVNASVLLFNNSQSAILGTINSSGSFSSTVSSATIVPNGIMANAIVYVKTGGINGIQSNSVSWPYVQNSTTTGNMTLSQSALLLNVGQTSTITSSANSLYLLSNSQPTIANINFNANQITIQALNYGSTVAKVCANGTSDTADCPSITITVQNSSAQQLSFSQNNFSIVSGQTVNVSVTGGSGSYTISSNSNSAAMQASISGSSVHLTANSTAGVASITVCTTNLSNCGIIDVSSTTVNSTAISFSQTNPVVPLSQTITVTIFGGTGNNFYVLSNSNPSIVQANISGNILTLIGNASTGTSSINICAVAGTCSSLTANVSNITSGGALALSQNTISILAGQSSSITISGGSTPYNISSLDSANIFNGVINGNILTIYGVNPGSSTANICSSAGCTTLSITINSTASSVNPPTFSQNNILLGVGGQTTVNISGNSGYYVANNTDANVASVQINGSSVVVYGNNAGANNISICQTGGQCATLYVTVSGTGAGSQLSLSQNSLSLTVGQTGTVYMTGGGSYYISNNSNPSIASVQVNGNSATVTALSALTFPQGCVSASGYSSTTGQQCAGGADSANIFICQTAGQCASLSVHVSVGSTPQNDITPTQSAYVFPRYLGYGDKGDDVLKLQQVLAQEGFLTATPNGHYGPATTLAIQKFQQNNGIKTTGNVGPSTLGAINKISVSAETSSTKEQQIAIIQQAIQQLLAQVAQLQGQ
jgi:hypothetical protein